MALSAHTPVFSSSGDFGVDEDGDVHLEVTHDGPWQVDYKEDGAGGIIDGCFSTETHEQKTFRAEPTATLVLHPDGTFESSLELEFLR